MCNNFLSLEKYLEIGFFIWENRIFLIHHIFTTVILLDIMHQWLQ